MHGGAGSGNYHSRLNACQTEIKGRCYRAGVPCSWGRKSGTDGQLGTRIRGSNSVGSGTESRWLRRLSWERSCHYRSVVGPQSQTVGIDGVSLSARLIKGGGDPDLSLLSMDERTLPTSLLERRMPLCQEQPPVGAPVILGAVRGITRTSIASPMLIPPEMRTKFSTLISEAETNGKSGSGVFDAEKKCLLGILSAKIRNNIENKDIASYFVPASAVQSFVPPGTLW